MKKDVLIVLFLSALWLASCTTSDAIPQSTPSGLESDNEEGVEAGVSIDKTPTPPLVSSSGPRPSPSHTAVSTHQIPPPATDTPQVTGTPLSSDIATPVFWHGRLAFAAQREDTNGDGQIGDGDGVHIFTLDIDSQALRQLTSGNQRDIHPTWSPSGNDIAFVSNRNGNFDLFTISADDSTVRQLTHTPEDETTPSWSPDGTQIAYVRVTTLESGEQKRNLHLLTIEGGVNQMLPVGPGNIFRPHWSPDGRYLSFERIDEIEQDGQLRRVTNIYFWDTVTSSLIKLDLEGSLFQGLILQYPKWLPTDQYRLSFTIQRSLSDVPTHQVKIYDLVWENGAPELRERLTLSEAPEPYTWGPNGEWYIAFTYNGFPGAERYDLINYPIDYSTKTLIIDTYNLLANGDIVAEDVYYYSDPAWSP